ncbi:MAG: hypothetical protein H7201_14455 [Candidatus Saccharibacteria bacterium]|nr:hypothetical protein [Microbacteriaceae bacterium]
MIPGGNFLSVAPAALGILRIPDPIPLFVTCCAPTRGQLRRLQLGQNL